MPSPTPEQVQALLTVQFTDAEITSFLDDAILLLGEGVYDGARETAILKYLTAHLITITPKGSEGVLSAKKIEDLSYSYARGSLGEGLRSTTFGQQALALDVKGMLPDKLDQQPFLFQRL